MGTASCKEACGSGVGDIGDASLQANNPTGSPVVASYVPSRKRSVRFTVLLEGPLFVCKKKRTIDANSTEELITKAIEVSNLKDETFGAIEVFDPQFETWVEPCFEEMQGGLLRMRFLPETAAPPEVVEKSLMRTPSVLMEISALKQEVALATGAKQSIAGLLDNGEGPKPRGRSSSVIEEIAIMRQCASESEELVDIRPEEDKNKFKIGSGVRIAKKGSQEGNTAVVTNSNWNGMVKVDMDGTHTAKSYHREELELVELTEEQAVEVMIIPLQNDLSALKLSESASLLHRFFNKTPWGAGDATTCTAEPSGSAAEENRKRKHVIKTTVTTPVAVKNISSFLKGVCTPQNVPQLLARFEMTASAFGVLNHIADASGPNRAIIFRTILQEGLLDSLVAHIASWRVKDLTEKERPLAEEISDMSLKVLMKLTRQEAKIDRVLANEYHRAWDDDDVEGI
jgi:hypothetical protein